MAEIIKEIQNIRSRRAISDRPIPKDVLKIILNAAILAPSCSNNQPWRFALVTENRLLSALKAALNEGNYWARPSPAIVAVGTAPGLDCRSTAGRGEKIHAAP